MHTPEQPKQGIISKKKLDNERNCASFYNKRLSPETWHDVDIEDSQILDPSPEVSQESSNTSGKLRVTEVYKRKRGKRVKTKSSRNISSLFDTGKASATANNFSMLGMAAKDTGSGIQKKRKMRKSHIEITERQSTSLSMAQSRVVDAPNMARRTDESVPIAKIYYGILLPPKKPPIELGDIIEGLQRLNIDDTQKQLVPRKHRGKKKHLVDLYGSNNDKVAPKVEIDQESEREFNQFMEVFCGGSEEEKDEDRKQYWEEERQLFRGRVLFFIACMHLLLGDRRFSEWKGSVVDSVVGVFLTQNVSDHLSSSAFMSLASKFPIQPSTNCKTTSTEAVENVIKDVRPLESFGSKNISIAQEIKLENVHFSGNDQIVEAKTHILVSKSEVGEENASNIVDWDDLRKTYSGCTERKTTAIPLDSVDWEAVRRATVFDVAEAIKIRGQQQVLAKRIKDFLDRLVRDHGSINLEWLRNVPPDKTKAYLLSFQGLGLKSVECVRLLTLHHHAFPADSNVARVAVRLGWVPLEPLPDSLQFHLLDKYPLMDKVQVYLWPRLCTLDQRTLYELHYHMITFGKVFCSKRKPNCASCPLKGMCKHYASKSSRPILPRFEEKSTSSEIVSVSTVKHSVMLNKNTRSQNETLNPIIEYPPSPSKEPRECLVPDIEDLYKPENVDVHVDEDDIPIIRLDSKAVKERLLEVTSKSNILIPEGYMSTALTTLTSEASSTPPPKLKVAQRMRTVHHVYKLPDSHPILEGVEKRDLEDPSPYLLVTWASEAKASSCDSFADENSETVRGTLMIPVRTANRGRFPLNGTYFQVNEVFADDESSQHPIKVPGRWLWNLERGFLYCGSGTTSICDDLSAAEIRSIFWKGWVCDKAFNRKTRAPVPLPEKFHILTTAQAKRKSTKQC